RTAQLTVEDAAQRRHTPLVEPCHIDIFCAARVQYEPDELSPSLNGGPIVQLIRHQSSRFTRTLLPNADSCYTTATVATKGPMAEPTTMYRTPLVGRDDVLGEIATSWRDGTRWLTLVGPPGAGKTRIAAECIARVREIFDLPSNRVR